MTTGSSDPAIVRRVWISFAVGFVGIAALDLCAPRYERLALRPFALLGVLAAACGFALAVGLRIAPAPRAMRLRHLAAGATAAWIAYELAAVAQLLGLPSSADAFPVLWAPVVEETCKSLLLAAAWSRGDERRDRLEIVSAAVGVGIGFALRENLVYFAQRLGQPPVMVAWLFLRAIPPVLAHATFGMILGGTVAHTSIQSRVTGERVRGVSMIGAAVAMLAHFVYNGIALALSRYDPARSVELTACWSVVVFASAVLLRNHIVRTAETDVPLAPSLIPPRPSSLRPVPLIDDAPLADTPPPPLLARLRARVPRDHAARVVFALVLVDLALWCIPVVLPRYVAVMLTPSALAVAAAFVVARALRQERFAPAVMLGVALRPFVYTGDRLVATLAEALQRPALRLPLAALSNVVWVGAIAFGAHLYARRRGRLASASFATGLAAGLVGAHVGIVLAASFTPGGHGMVRVMIDGIARLLPRTIALGALAGLLAHRSATRAASVALAVALVATAYDELVRRLRPGPLGYATLVVAGVAGVSAVVVAALRRARTEQTAAAAVAAAAEPVGVGTGE